MQQLNVLDQVAHFILTAPDKEFAGLSVSGLAFSFNIDRSKLSRDFKRVKKINLEDFMFKERMGRAQIMLITNDGITVKEVSEKIGYLTYDYFIRKFKEFYGIAPGKYKELKSGKTFHAEV